MFHNCNPQDGQLFANLQRAAIALSALAELNRSLLEENEAKDETIKDQQQVIDDLKRELDCQPNYCENDGSSNCIMSRSRICYG